MVDVDTGNKLWRIDELLSRIGGPVVLKAMAKSVASRLPWDTPDAGLGVSVALATMCMDYVGDLLIEAGKSKVDCGKAIADEIRVVADKIDAMRAARSET